MALTLLSALRQLKEILPASLGGTGLSSPGTAGNVLTSNGSGAWVSSPAPVNNNFTLDGGASNTSYVGVPKMDLGGSI